MQKTATSLIAFLTVLPHDKGVIHRINVEAHICLARERFAHRTDMLLCDHNVIKVDFYWMIPAILCR